MEFSHVPVLLNECLEGLNIKGGGVYLDGTLGGGGHSLEIVKRLTSGKLIANDLDAEAIAAASERLKAYSDKINYVQGNFKDLTERIAGNFDGILLDLGVSSYQIDNAERGFSYMHDAALDMRMDRTSGLTAEKVINTYPEKELVRVIKEYGEDDFASRIASFIVRAREKRAIESTLELAKIIEESIPGKFRWTRGHPAKKTFQALRIEVNGELDGLYEAVVNLGRRLNPDGRMCVISFHSLEDRIIKNAYRYLECDCVCDKKSPICTCGKVSEAEILTKKPIVPGSSEQETNSRAASAKLRILRKL